MELVPEYCENIVAGVIYKGHFEWYVTPYDIWFLDLDKRYEAYRRWYIENGRTEKRFIYDLGDKEHYFGHRYGIGIADKDTADKLLSKIDKYRTETAELKEWFDIENDKTNVYPILLIDFDKKRLVSYCPEPFGYENYVPKGWVGEYKDIIGLVPIEKIYWN